MNRLVVRNIIWHISQKSMEAFYQNVVIYTPKPPCQQI